MRNLRQFLQTLRESGEVADIYQEVDPYLEIAEIHRRTIANGGPALFFHHVKNSSFPVVTNLFGTKRRVELAFGRDPEKMISELVHLLTRDFPPKPSLLWKQRSFLKRCLHLGTIKKRFSPVKEFSISPVDLEKLPLLTCWPKDGGPFITLPLVYTQSPESDCPNLGMYRVQRYDKKRAGLHFQIGKGAGFHFEEAERADKPLPVNIFLGGSPALILSAIAPLPENVSEIMLCSFLLGEKLSYSNSPFNSYPLFSECEFALIGKAPPKVRHPEGPFGDHYGYYSLKHDFPLFECEAIYHRKNAIYPATVVGKPCQEDYFLGNYLQKLLSPLIPLTMPGVKQLFSFGETGFHSLAGAMVKERFGRECMQTAFRILGEGQLSFTKTLLLTDAPVDLTDFKKLLTTILERAIFETDLFIFSNLCLDTLDYTGPKLNEGSRAVLLGIGEPKRTLPQEFQGTLPKPLSGGRAYCSGCLVLEAPPFEHFQEHAHIYNHPDFAPWPLLILVDNLKKALDTFLWTVFTRFEPAADIHAKKTTLHRNHLSFSAPLLIDARMKPSYPPEVECG